MTPLLTTTVMSPMKVNDHEIWPSAMANTNTTPLLVSGSVEAYELGSAWVDSPDLLPGKL